MELPSCDVEVRRHSRLSFSPVLSVMGRSCIIVLGGVVVWGLLLYGH